jgi:hypothetical protein
VSRETVVPQKPRGFYTGKPRIVLDALFGMVALYFAYAFMFPGSAAPAGSAGTYWLTSAVFLAASMYFFVSSSGALAVQKGYPRRYAWFGLLTVPGFIVLLLLPARVGPSA